MYAKAGRVSSFVEGNDPLKYVIVYPFIKTREWCLLPVEQRKKMTDEHIIVGQKFPQVVLNTTYSFGIHDEDFMLALKQTTCMYFRT